MVRIGWYDMVCFVLKICVSPYQLNCSIEIYTHQNIFLCKECILVRGMDTISLFFVTLAGDSRDLCDSVRCHFYATVVDKLQTRERGVGSEIQVR